MSRAKKRADELSLIKGIGPVRQEWLRESLGVYTFRELAVCPVEVIETRLREAGEIVSAREIGRWIAQARKLAEESGGTRATRELAALHDAAVAKHAPWRPFASFVVEYQSRLAVDGSEELRTTVHHIEGDSGTAWPGIEPTRHCEWMRTQLGERSRGPAAAAAKAGDAQAGAKTVRTTAHVEIDQVRIFQPPEALQPVGVARAGLPFGAPLRSDEAFAVEATYRVLDGDAAADTGTPMHCTARFLARDFNAKDYQALGESLPEHPAEEPRQGFVARLPRVSLKAGLYRLRVLVAPDAGAAPGYTEIPLLQTV
jgi:hypothetical protein